MPTLSSNDTTRSVSSGPRGLLVDAQRPADDVTCTSWRGFRELNAS